MNILRYLINDVKVDCLSTKLKCLKTCNLQMLRRIPQILTKGSSVTFCSSMQSEVIHDVESNMFYIKLGNDKAYVQYDKFNNVLDLFETEVPEQFRGKGVAQILAKAAFDHVVTNNLKMKVTCTYLQHYLTKNPIPEYVSRVVE